MRKLLLSLLLLDIALLIFFWDRLPGFLFLLMFLGADVLGLHLMGGYTPFLIWASTLGGNTGDVLPNSVDTGDSE